MNDETQVYHIRVRDGEPLRLYIHADAPPENIIEEQNLSQWTIGADAYKHFPAVIAYIYYMGSLPSDEGRDDINLAVAECIGTLLEEQYGELED